MIANEVVRVLESVPLTGYWWLNVLEVRRGDRVTFEVELLEDRDDVWVRLSAATEYPTVEWARVAGWELARGLVLIPPR